MDFWNSSLGIDVEIDGPEHNQVEDQKRDAEFLQVSGILVFRVRNFNQSDMLDAISKIRKTNDWLERRESLGLLTKAQKRLRGLL